MANKIGFCCKWLSDNPMLSGKALAATVERMNQKGTTQKYMASRSSAEQFEKVKGLVQHNIDTLYRQLEWIAIQPESMRLFRITSEFLPLYTLQAYRWIYDTYQLKELIAESLRGVRKFADANQIRLCMHPGQFTNLCATKKEIIQASIEDFEYHAYLASSMGYGDTWHSSGFAINLHANVNQDPGLKNIRRIIANYLSDTARNLITLENDEYSCSITDYTDNLVHEDVALVLDIHHHWVSSKGEHIASYDDRIIPFVNSWRGQRPLGHLSMPSTEKWPANMIDPRVLPDYKQLVAIKGISSRELRSHSFDCWNTVLLYWAAAHIQNMDIEVEAKGKNIASKQFHDFVEKHYPQLL